MTKLSEEFNKVKAQNFELDFRYPTAEEREKLNIVNRDKDVRIIRQGTSNIGQLIEDMKAGRIFIEDFPTDQVEILRGLLSKGDAS